jgi:hypothetical protein
MRTVARGFLLALALLGTAAPALAHHSFAAEFDAQKPITMKVPAPDGTATEWMIETSNPNGLMRLGWRKDSLKAGDEITVEGYLAKDGSSTANAARITLADGRKVFAGSSSGDAPAVAPNGQ